MHAVVLKVSADQLLSAAPSLRAMVVLYVGPDQILPLTSALGAIVGVLLMFWQRVVGIARNAWQWGMQKLHASAKHQP